MSSGNQSALSVRRGCTRLIRNRSEYRGHRWRLDLAERDRFERFPPARGHAKLSCARILFRRLPRLWADTLELGLREIVVCTMCRASFAGQGWRL